MVDKRSVIEFIDARIERGHQWIRAAFYSDPEVERIVEALYIRWRENEHRGEPIDYANDEELELLYNLAKRYASMTPYEAYVVYMRRLEERE